MKLTAQLLVLYVAVAVLAACALYLLTGNAISVKAKAGDLPATVATTSNPTVNTTASLVFATSTCGARIISTTASPIMITFSDNQGSVPTGTFGMLQAASTTVNYDNGQYGCAAVRVYSFVSGPITVMESR